jgi:hypothetical protein
MRAAWRRIIVTIPSRFVIFLISEEGIDLG